MPCGYTDRTSGRDSYFVGCRQPRAMAAATGLRPRRADEDRNGHGGNCLRSAAFADHRVADRGNHPQYGLEELDGSSSGGGFRRVRGEAEAGYAAAAGACRSRRRDQVQLPRCPLRAGAGERAGDNGARGGRGAGEGAAGAVRDRSAEPRDRCGSGAAGAAGGVGRTGGARAKRTKCCWAAWTRRRKRA